MFPETPRRFPSPQTARATQRPLPLLPLSVSLPRKAAQRCVPAELTNARDPEVSTRCHANRPPSQAAPPVNKPAPLSDSSPLAPPLPPASTGATNFPDLVGQSAPSKTAHLPAAPPR